MGWSIRRSKGLFGGLFKVNLSKTGLGFSVGVKGARVGVDAKGRPYSQVSIPHTGIYNRQYYGNVSAPAQPQAASFCPNCGMAVGAGGQFCRKCGKPLVAAAVPGEKSSMGRKLGIATVIALGFLALLAIIGSETKPSGSSSTIANDADLIISRCGKPDVDDSSAYDNPRPPIPIRFVEYKAQRVRFSFLPGGGTRPSDPPPYHWKLLGLQDTVTDQPLDASLATRRMPCWSQH
jgi:hypothetical protein